MSLDDATLDAIVAGVLARLATEAPVAAPAAPAPSAPCGGEAGHACTATPRPVHAVESPVYEAMLPRLVALTSSQVAVVAPGNRFRTDLYLQVVRVTPTRATRCTARSTPRGRRVTASPPSRRAAATGTNTSSTPTTVVASTTRRGGWSSGRRGSRPDVVLVVGDGLSANAVTVNGSDTLEALRAALAAAGLRTGAESYFVKFARIGVADEIGVITGARASVMLVGERPGSGRVIRCRCTSRWPRARSGQRREKLHLECAAHRDSSARGGAAGGGDSAAGHRAGRRRRGPGWAGGDNERDTKAVWARRSWRVGSCRTRIRRCVRGSGCRAGVVGRGVRSR